jgi:hypothetical protein
LGKTSHDGQDTEYILKMFASNRPEAIRGYREFVKKGIGQPQLLFAKRLKETYNLMSLNFTFTFLFGDRDSRNTCD